MAVVKDFFAVVNGFFARIGDNTSLVTVVRSKLNTRPKIS
jgi:hypothetical protein